MKNKLTIFFALFLSLLISYFANKSIFIANTPLINKVGIIASIRQLQNIPISLSNLFKKNKPFDMYAYTSNSNKQIASTVEKSLPFKQMSRGVYAAEDKKNKHIYYKVEKGETIEVKEYTITLKNGEEKVLKIITPIE